MTTMTPHSWERIGQLTQNNNFQVRYVNVCKRCGCFNAPVDEKTDGLKLAWTEDCDLEIARQIHES